MIKTSKVTDRRSLRFGRMEDVLRDVEVLNNRIEAGAKVRAAGNWTPAQIVDHITKATNCSLDGFPLNVKAPLPVRVIARMTRQSVLIKPMKPGLNLSSKVAALFAPDADVTWGQAVTRLRHAIERLRKGERMTGISPAFGPLVHEEWIQMHCRHAELHLSFIHVG